MKYIEARNYVEELTIKKGSVLGLDNIKTLLHNLDNPQDKLSVIHVAGTNGKGSFTAFMKSILINAGYSVGVYNSPSVFEYNERIKINDDNISDDEYAKGIEYIKDNLYDVSPTAFEVETALAFYYFEKKNCDIAIIETGMGGLTDATNVCENPLVSVLMSISMDHTQFLGNTIEKITECKAGIIKENAPVIVLNQDERILNIIRNIADNKNSEVVITNKPENCEYGKLTTFDYTSSKLTSLKDINISMIGTYQIDNATVAIETALLLRNRGYKLNDKNIKEGLRNAVWHGRFEKISDNPLMYIDGAHNLGAAKRLKESIETYFYDYEIIYIMGIFSDKDYEGVIGETANKAKYIYTITSPNSRAMKAYDLAEEIKKYNKNVKACVSINESVKEASAKYQSLKSSKRIIIAFGSLSYLGEIKKIFDGGEKENEDW